MNTLRTTEADLRTSIRQISLLLQLTPATLVLLGGPSLAQAQEDTGYRHYRCTVLGESRACPAAQPIPAERVEVLVVPGSYARHLIYLGQDPAHAIEAARSIGEVPTRRTVKVTTRQLTSFERYERHQGRLNLPDEERKILAEVPIEATIQAKESR